MEAPSSVRLYLEGGRYEDTTDQKMQCRSCKRVYTVQLPYALDGNTIIPGSIRLESDIGSGDFILTPKLKDTRGISVKLLQTMYRAQMTSASSYRDVAVILCKMGLGEYSYNGGNYHAFRKVVAR